MYYLCKQIHWTADNNKCIYLRALKIDCENESYFFLIYDCFVHYCYSIEENVFIKFLLPDIEFIKSSTEKYIFDYIIDDPCCHYWFV